MNQRKDPKVNPIEKKKPISEEEGWFLAIIVFSRFVRDVVVVVVVDLPYVIQADIIQADIVVFVVEIRRFQKIRVGGRLLSGASLFYIAH